MDKRKTILMFYVLHMFTLFWRICDFLPRRQWNNLGMAQTGGKVCGMFHILYFTKKFNLKIYLVTPVTEADCKDQKYSQTIFKRI